MGRLELEDFLQYKMLSAVEWNPSGTKAGFLKHEIDAEENCYHTSLWLYDKVSETVREAGTQGVKNFFWLSDTEIIYTCSPKEKETAFYKLNLETGDISVYFTVPFGGAAVAGVLDDGIFVLTAVRDLIYEKKMAGKSGKDAEDAAREWEYDKESYEVFDEYPFWLNGAGVINKKRKSIFLYNRKDGSLKRITKDLFRTEEISVNKALGKIVYTGMCFDSVCTYRTGLYIYDVKTGEESMLAEPGKYCISQVGMLGDQVVFVYYKKNPYDEDQCPELISVDTRTKKASVLCSQELSMGNPVGSDCRYGSGKWFRIDHDKVYFISGIEEDSHLLCCDKYGNLTPVITETGSIDCFDVRNGSLVMAAMYNMQLEELYTADMEGRCWKKTDFNGAFCREHPPVHPEKIRFINHQGVEVHGMVLKPVGYDPQKSYPAILDIHGGPRTTYGEVYYHEMQVWANHGYFVFFCNPTGSDGRGNDFGFMGGRYGTVDYEDIMQFTDAVLEKYPAIDRKRVGVAGGSYGGFMVNWIIGHTDRFAAAVAQRSISNMGTMELCTDMGKVSAERQTWATVHSDPERVWATSPLKFADKVKTPTLFIHADQDYRCWMAEALQMYTALKYRGVDSRLCLFKGENHELSRSGKPRSRIRRLREMNQWFDHYLKQGK